MQLRRYYGKQGEKTGIGLLVKGNGDIFNKKKKGIVGNAFLS